MPRVTREALNSKKYQQGKVRGKKIGKGKFGDKVWIKETTRYVYWQILLIYRLIAPTKNRYINVFFEQAGL